MWIREWKCLCPFETTEGFMAYLDETGVKDTQKINGCTGYQVLKRKVSEQTEITFLSFWESKELMTEYAGENLYTAVLYPEDHKYRIIPDTEVQVYEVISGTGYRAFSDI